MSHYEARKEDQVKCTRDTDELLEKWHKTPDHDLDISENDALFWLSRILGIVQEQVQEQVP